MTEAEWIKAVEHYGIQVTEIQKQQLEQYYQLLVEWNEKMNLTGITEKNDVYLKHFYDSITLLEVIELSKENTLCDIGTGAGFPGLVLKIIYPELEVTLVDALQKRIGFLNHVIDTLHLSKITTIHARAEEYGMTHREVFDVVTARAVASLPTLLEYTTPLLKVGKYFIPMKAKMEGELEQAKGALQKLNMKLIKMSEFQLPKEDSKRTILKFQKLEKTALKYPRKYSEIKHRPL